MRLFVVSLAAAGLLAAATAAYAVPVSFKQVARNTDWTSAAVGGVGGGTGTITLGGVSGPVTKAYLYWHGMNSSGAYDNPNITLNDSPVTGTSLGDAGTNCWGAGSSRAFVADVTALVTGNGAYVLAGLGALPGNNANGASLIVLFDDGDPNNNRDLAFFDGNDSNNPEGFPGEDWGWNSTLAGIRFQGGTVNAQAHTADGQRFYQDGLDDHPLFFSSASGSVTIPDAGGLWDGESVPNAGTSRASNGSLWDLHTFDISSAFTTPGWYTLSMYGQIPNYDCLGLVVLLIDLQAGSMACGDGIVDQNEQCDTASQIPTCTSPSVCTGKCICGCELDSQCDDGDACTADVCTQTSGECTHHDICSTTTTTQGIYGACCANGQCFVTAQWYCESGVGGTYQGDSTSCETPGICSTCGNGVVEYGEQCDDGNTLSGDGCDANCQLESITTTTSLPSSSTTTLPPATGACCANGRCFVTGSGLCEFGTYQGDGTSCETPGICSACGNGLIESGEECDDANTTAGDGCDASCKVEQCWACSADAIPTTTLGPPATGLPGPSRCSYDNGASCDDGDQCTVGDTCSGGICGGNAVMIPAACRWVMVGNTKVQSRTRGQSSVTGHICGGRVRLGEFTTNSGDAVATLASGVGIQISSHAAVAGNIVTGGSAVRGKPRLVHLPGLSNDLVPGGTTAVRADSTSIYDTLATNARVGDCADAQGDISAGNSLLAGLPAGTNLGSTLIAASTALTLTATNPGGVNVFDFRKLMSARDATLTLDAAGDPGSVFVLRVQKKLDLRLRSKIVLAGGAVPGNVILYSQAKCRFGLEVSGVGTVFCPNGKLILEPRTKWQGALVGGKGRVELRDSGVLVHMPLQVGS